MLRDLGTLLNPQCMTRGRVRTQPRVPLASQAQRVKFVFPSVESRLQHFVAPVLERF